MKSAQSQSQRLGIKMRDGQRRASELIALDGGAPIVISDAMASPVPLGAYTERMLEQSAGKGDGEKTDFGVQDVPQTGKSSLSR